MAYAGSFSRRLSCGAKPPPKAAALLARISRTSFNSLNITAESHSNKKLCIDECKEPLRKRRRLAEARRRIEEAGNINMSNTPFTNIKTYISTSSHEQQETQPATRAAAPTRLHHANAAYGVNLCHSTYRKLIDGGYVAS